MVFGFDPVESSPAALGLDNNTCNLSWFSEYPIRLYLLYNYIWGKLIYDRFLKLL